MTLNNGDELNLVSLKEVVNSLELIHVSTIEAIKSLKFIINLQRKELNRFTQLYYFSVKFRKNPPDIVENLHLLDGISKQITSEELPKALQILERIKIYPELLANLYLTLGADNLPEILKVPKQLDTLIKQNFTPDYKVFVQAGNWNHVEAACLLGELNPKYAEYKNSLGADGYIIEVPKGFEHVKENLEVIQRWFKGTSFLEAPAFYYIDRALDKRMSIPSKLWNEAEIEFRIAAKRNKKFISTYPAIAEKLELNEDPFFNISFTDLPEDLQFAIKAYINSSNETKPKELSDEAKWLSEREAHNRHNWWKQLSKEYKNNNPKATQREVAKLIRQRCQEVIAQHPELKEIEIPQEATIRSVIGIEWPSTRRR